MLVLVLAVGLFFSSFNSYAADEVRGSGSFAFYINDGSKKSMVTVTVSRSSAPSATMFWNNSTTWNLSISGTNAHGIQLGATTVNTSKDNSGNYRIFTIPITFTQPAHYQLSGLKFTNAGNVGSEIFTASVSSSPVHQNTSRTISFRISGSQMGVCTYNGDWKTGTARATATFTKPSHTITVNNNGGTGAVNTLTRVCGEPVGSIPAPTRAEYTFDGYFYPDGTAVNATDPVCSSRTITAKWTPVTTTETFDPNDNSTPAGSLTVYIGNSEQDTVRTWETEATFTNTAREGSVTIHKKDGKGKALKGVVYALHDEAGAEVKTGTTDGNGTLVFDHLPIGKYTIQETKTVPGNSLLSKPVEVQVPMHLTEEEAKEQQADTAQAVQGTDGYYFYDLTYDITNDAVLNLPKTGAGEGYLGLIVGLAALLAGIWLCAGKERRRRRAGRL